MLFGFAKVVLASMYLNITGIIALHNKIDLKIKEYKHQDCRTVKPIELITIQCPVQNHLPNESRLAWR